ncbi:hypothetical protein K435DRAFT_166822 [Dendrothele bispora CBS 962.96]|uniref:Uncharacterized protein n=1 Tax=Dendrothele bispora (strain CBS 962.96) TaxID=1314807 RepID=A0A4S8LWX9_DENBC|nr:hypothetical protein K435DRAFT_166822 [Dendrothele bispora CBS 962.96]
MLCWRGSRLFFFMVYVIETFFSLDRICNREFRTVPLSENLIVSSLKSAPLFLLYRRLWFFEFFFFVYPFTLLLFAPVLPPSPLVSIPRKEKKAGFQYLIHCPSVIIVFVLACPVCPSLSGPPLCVCPICRTSSNPPAYLPLSCCCSLPWFHASVCVWRRSQGPTTPWFPFSFASDEDSVTSHLKRPQTSIMVTPPISHNLSPKNPVGYHTTHTHDTFVCRYGSVRCSRLLSLGIVISWEFVSTLGSFLFVLLFLPFYCTSL